MKRFERERVRVDFDQAVFLHFKPDASLYWADPNDLPGLKTVGAPELHPEATSIAR